MIVSRVQQIAGKLNASSEQLKQYWHVIKLVGDTMALRMVDIDLIKQFGLVQATGYVSGKEGLEAELEAAGRFLELGYFVLLNDLTHSLKVSPE